MRLRRCPAFACCRLNVSATARHKRHNTAVIVLLRVQPMQPTTLAVTATACSSPRLHRPVLNSDSHASQAVVCGVPDVDAQLLRSDTLHLRHPAGMAVARRSNATWDEEAQTRCATKSVALFSRSGGRHKNGRKDRLKARYLGKKSGRRFNRE